MNVITHFYEWNNLERFYVPLNIDQFIQKDKHLC